MRSIGLAAALLLLLLGVARAESWQVVDGDTILVQAGPATPACSKPYRDGRERVQIIGIDAPEWSEAQCPAEQVRAEAAREALRSMLSRAGAVIERNGECDGDSRSLARVRAGNFDLAAEMVRRGLAKAYDRRGPKPTWC